MRPPRRLALTAFLAVAACGGAEVVRVEEADPQAPTGGVNAESWHDAPYVVLLSLDGFAARYMQRHEPEHLVAMAAEGVWAPDGMIGVYPTKTFPNHYSIATGLYPAHHGIVGNTFWDPEREQLYRIADRAVIEDGTWYGGEPLWITAERQGMVAASFFWVGSEADIQDTRPSYWRRFDGSVPNEVRVDQVLAWLELPVERRPHMVTLYMSDTDDAGHAAGAESGAVARAVARVDAMVGRLREGIAALPHGDRVAVIVVSDHGMDSYGSEDVRAIAEVTEIDDLRMPESGPHGTLSVDGPRERVLEVRDAINTGLDGVTAYLQEDVPEHLRLSGNPRIGDLVLVVDSGRAVQLEGGGGSHTHGWDPTFLGMRALFVAAGGGLPEGASIESFENVHIYPLVTRLLGLEPAEGIDGDPARWDPVIR